MLRFFWIFNHFANPIKREKGYQSNEKKVCSIAYYRHCLKTVCKKVSDGVKQRCHV